MKKSVKNLSKYFFIFIAIVISIFFLYLGLTNNIKTEAMNVKNGKVSINEPLGESKYSLVGDWEYYPDETLFPEDLIEKNSNGKNYEFIDKHGLHIDGNFATFAIVIENNSEQELNVRFPKFTGGYRILLNGAEISTNYNKFTNKIVPSMYSDIDVALNKVGFNKIIVQISREDYFIFGLNLAPTIAKSSFFVKEDADVEKNKAVAATAILLFMIFLIVLHFGSFGPEKSIYPIIYLVLVLFFTFVEFTIGDYMKFDNYYEFSKVFSIISSIIALLILTFISNSFKEYKKVRICYATALWLVSFYIVFVVFSSIEYSNFAYRLFLIVYVYLLSSALYIATIALSNKNRDAIYIFAIISIIFLTFSINTKFSHIYIFNTRIFFAFLISFFIIIGKMLNENFKYAVNFRTLEYNLVYKSKLKHTELIEYNDTLLAEIVARKEAEQNLVEITTKDYLSGLYNRLYGNKKLSELSKQYNEEKDGFFCVIMVDIDNFKYINDTYGHDCGDEVIKIISKVMLSTTRHTDIVTRWGGEEFLIILPSAKIESAIYVSEKLRKNIESTIMPIAGKITASLGVAQMMYGENYESTITRADENLYIAKKSGKNRTYPNI